MKKFCLRLFLLFLVFSLSLSAAAQEELTVNEQYETFSWDPVAKAKQYEIVVEKFDTVEEIWKDYKTVKTTETSLEILFTPGTFRVALATYNVIGRRGKQSQWVMFKILEETIPYLNDRFLPKSNVWNVPVLYINRKGTNQDSNSDYSNYIQPAEGYASSILVKGRNIFSPKTEFYLIPKDQNPLEAKQFENYCDDRKEQKLTVIQRNSKDYSVIVSYDADSLRQGYYSLEVRNPGNEKDSVDLLVLDDSDIVIQPEKGFEIDEHYNVNSFSVGNSTYEFSVEAKGVNSNTIFYLEPATGALTYPFETAMTRQRLDATVTGHFIKGAGKAQITLSCEGDKMRTGYYNLVAQNPDGSTAKFICLVKRPFDHDYTKNVKKLKTKFNKKTEYVEVTINDEKFTSAKQYTLVSQYNEGIDANYKVNLILSQNGKKLTGTLTPDQLSIAKYALIVEDAYTSDVVYCDIDTTLKISMQKMTSLDVERTFFRPAGAGNSVTLDVEDAGTIQFFDNDIEMIKRMPMFFTNFAVNISLLKDSTTIINTDLDLFNCGFASFSTGYEFRIGSEFNTHNIFSTIRFGIPNNYVKPYIGIGIGQTLAFPENGINNFDDAKNMLLDKNQTYAFAQAGVILFTIIDVRYNLFLNKAFVSPYFSDSIYVGFTFPLRAYKFKRNVITRSAIITKQGVMQASQFIDSTSNVDEVTLNSSNSIGGFQNYGNLKKVTVDTSVSVIEQDAFRNCKNLESVEFLTGIGKEEIPLTIKSGAFAGDRWLDSILLPSRTVTVENEAFSEWTNGQIIRLSWNKDDTTTRDLRGLENCSATVIYFDGEFFNKTNTAPLAIAQNWISLNEFKIENVSVYKDNIYTLGVNLEGFGYKWYRNELYTWINQDSPAEVVNYLKSGDKISFKVQGDGNKYDFVIATPEGGYFYYRFNTKKDAVTTVEIPYKKFKKYNFSSQKKLDVDNIKMFCILPMCKEEWNDVSFYDFEVK